MGDTRVNYHSKKEDEPLSFGQPAKSKGWMVTKERATLIKVSRNKSLNRRFETGSKEIKAKLNKAAKKKKKSEH